MEKRDDKKSQATQVSIFGSEFSVMSQESPDYTHKISDFVDRRMTEIASELNLADPTKVAIMTALDIADNLLQRRERHKAEKARAVEAVERLGRYLDRTDRNEGSA